VHLARRRISTAAATATAAPGLSTGRTALRVLVSAVGVELLVVGAERKLGTTLDTGEGTVFKGHSMTSFLIFG
jgi:hypothetical protein